MTQLGISERGRSCSTSPPPPSPTPSPPPPTTKRSSSAAHILTPVVLCILVTETGERFAYFGFRAVLTLYFKDELEFEERRAIALFAFTTCLAYLSPVGGAILADTKLGRYSTILWFGVIYMIGLFILTGAAYSEESLSISARRFWSAAGLLLICMGTGGIKPCVSAFGADQVAERKRREDAAAVVEEKEHEKDGLFNVETTVDASPTTARTNSEDEVRVFFSYFYFCINVGALTSIAVVPIIRANGGFGAAFALPSVFMVVAMLLFVSKRGEYVHSIPGEGGASLPYTFQLVFWLARRNLWTTNWFRKAFPRLDPGIRPPPQRGGKRELLPDDDGDDGAVWNAADDEGDGNLEGQLDDAAQILHVAPILLLFPIFWCLYDQQGSVWTLQASRMALNGLQPEQLNVINPLEIMIFIPLFDRIIYPFLQNRGVDISPLRRMTWGMLLTAMAFSASGIVESIIQNRKSNDLPELSVLWQIPQITILAVGEIFFSVTGLEFAYSTSPQRLKAFLMSLFLLTTAVGDLLSTVLYLTVFANMNMATIMHICAALMLVNYLLFRRVARWWSGHEASDFRPVFVQPEQGIELQ